MEKTHLLAMKEESNDTIDLKSQIPMAPNCQVLSFSCQTNNNSALLASGAGQPHSDYDSGRERLRRHREEVAGRVPIPDTWGHENLLKEWIDCSSFDKMLAPCGIASAREALVAEARCRASSQQLRFAERR